MKNILIHKLMLLTTVIMLGNTLQRANLSKSNSKETTEQNQSLRCYLLVISLNYYTEDPIPKYNQFILHQETGLFTAVGFEQRKAELYDLYSDWEWDPAIEYRFVLVPSYLCMG